MLTNKQSRRMSINLSSQLSNPQLGGVLVRRKRPNQWSSLDLEDSLPTEQSSLPHAQQSSQP